MEKSHSVLVTELNLISVVYKADEIKKIDDESNPLCPVDYQHYLLKTFLRAHKGFNRANLQDRLNLFWFIRNGPKDKYDKVKEFFRIATLSPKRVNSEIQ